jgi:subtilisin family serine protease
MNTKISNFFGKAGLVWVLSLLLAPILTLTSDSNSRAAPPPPEKTEQVQLLPPPQDEVNFETVALPPEAQFAPTDLTISQQASKNSKLDSVLADVAAAAKVSITEAVNLAKSVSLGLSDNRVQVQITTHAPGSENAIKAIVEAGGEVTGVSDDHTLIQGWLPVNALETIAAQPDVYYVHRPAKFVLLETLQVGNSTTEALDDMNATAWHAAGKTGAGVKIAVVDGGFIGYTGLLGTDLPASVTVKNFVDFETDTQVGSTTEHGTACAEVIHDIAPGAQLYLVKISTAIDLQQAVNYSIGQGVDIISTSLAWLNQTPGDGTGFFANLATQARNAGILWVTAAGNYRETHWGGLYSDPDGNNFHNFNGVQEVNYFGPGDGTAYLIPSGYLFEVEMRWNDWTNVNQDYNLYLVRWNGSSWSSMGSSCIAVDGTDSQNGGAGQTPTESAIGITCGSQAPYGFYITRRSSNRTVNFEIFAPNIAPLDELLYARSLANLADAPAAMTVAAVDVDSPYLQEPYSSEGPTNGPGGAATGGLIKPDISGYANVSTESYGTRGFNGTSAATPHVAGAAALVKEAYPDYSVNQLQNYLENNAIGLGTPGKDNLYGAGRLYLGDLRGSPELKIYLPLIIKNYSPGLPPTPTSPPPPTPSPLFASVLHLDGVDDFAVAADSPDLDIGDQADESLTIEAWANLQFSADAWPGKNRYIFNKPQSYSLYAQRYYDPGFGHIVGCIGFSITLPSGQLRDAQHCEWPAYTFGWHHIVGVFYKETGEIRIYMDGEALGDPIYYGSAINNSTEGLKVGVALTQSVEEVRISDVARYVGSTYTVPTSPFTCDAHTRALWHFDEAASATTFFDGEDGSGSSCGNVEDTLTGLNGAVSGP